MTDRYDQLGPQARALVDDFDELDLAEMLVKAQDKVTALRAAHTLDAPLRDQLQAAIKALGTSETILARVHQLLATGQIGCCAHLVRAALDQPAPAATERETTTRVFAALHRSAEQDVSRVIALYEQWVQAGPPPLGASMARWWDKRLVELHQAILPPVREQQDRPTHADGTPYSYAEITAEGWGYCDGCRMWSTGTPERPHQCPETHMRLATNQPKEK